MNKQTADQGWQQLQDHIEGFLGQFLRSDLQSIEYKPRFIALLEMPSEHHQNEFRKTSVCKELGERTCVEFIMDEITR